MLLLQVFPMLFRQLIPATSDMDPITWAIPVTFLVSLGLGIGVGYGVKPDGSAKALEAQAETLDVITTNQVELLEMSQRPITIDAELRASLANIPVQCLPDFGGNPNTSMCAWATCLQFGQSTAQRPECRAVEAIMVKEFEQLLSDKADQ